LKLFHNLSCVLPQLGVGSVEQLRSALGVRSRDAEGNVLSKIPCNANTGADADFKTTLDAAGGTASTDRTHDEETKVYTDSSAFLKVID